MDPKRTRIHADLSGLLEGQVLCDDLFLQMYATDASIFQLKPLAVVRPQNEADVVAVIKYAAENQIAVHPRGAGSSVTGASLGTGIVLDFSVNMRRIVQVDNNIVTVQPGAVLSSLNRQLAMNGRVFGPDPATRSVTTVGGVVSTNATGSHWVKFGSPREKVLGLKVVLSDGSQLTLDSRANANFRTNFVESQWHRDLQHLVNRHRSIIDQHRPKTSLDQAGYYLHDISHSDMLDLTRVFVGSEGTLGVITEATLLTDPKPAFRGVVMFFFDRIEKAANAVHDISQFEPSACDIMDRRLMTMARELDPQYLRLIPPAAEAMLLVEFDGADLATVRSRIDSAVNRIAKRKRMAFAFRETTQKQERDLFWRLARRVIPILYRLKGNERAIPFIEDIAIEPKQIAPFIGKVHSILNRHEVTASIFSHALQGHIDIRPFLDISNRDHVKKMKALAKDVFDLAIESGGTISGGMGDGLSRTWYLRSQFGALYDVYRDVKRVFDPEFRLNPGKIVNYPFSDLTENLRQVGVGNSIKTLPEELKPENRTDANFNNGRGATIDQDSGAIENGTGTKVGNSTDRTDGFNEVDDFNDQQNGIPKDLVSLPILEPQLNWDVEEIAQVARSCNGCGRCRTMGNLERMCPIFRLLPAEEASPRAKANLMRNVLNGQIELERLAGDDMKTIADLCVNCHQCRAECPANVDIPKLVTEIKAQHIGQSGMRVSQWMLTRLDLVFAIGGSFPTAVNWAIKNRTMRWLMDKMFGIAQGRKLPKFARRRFLGLVNRRNSAIGTRTAGGNANTVRRVAYFVDGVANWNDTEIGRALLKVMEHNGVEVYVPQKQKMSGMSLISEGLVVRARKDAAKNVEILADAVRQGYHIVTTEPSAGLALKHEYLNLLNDPDARLVAENTSDANDYLWNLHKQGLLELDFKPINAVVGYHMPCHMRAICEDTPAVHLLNLVPGLSVQHIEKGCSGMAGTFGLKRKNYRRSLRAGVELISALRAPEIIAGVTDCGTCKIQMEHGTIKPTLHPIKILALAYGLMPELSDLLNRRSQDRVLS